MSEASTVEEDYDRDDLGGAQGLLKIHDTPLRLVLGGKLVNTVEEAGGSVDVIKRENPVNRNCVGGDFPVEELRQLAVECSVGTAEEVVSQLEIGD